MESNLKSRRSWSFWVSCMHVQIWCSHLNAIFRLPTQFFAHQSGQRSNFRESWRWSHKLPHSTTWFQLGNAIRSLPHFDRLSQVTQYWAVVLFRNKNHEKVSCCVIGIKTRAAVVFALEEIKLGRYIHAISPEHMNRRQYWSPCQLFLQPFLSSALRGTRPFCCGPYKLWQNTFN